MTQKLNILIDIGHPAHVHLFRNARKILLERGHKVFVLARNKEVTFDLLKAYQIEFFKGTSQKTGFPGRVAELCRWFNITHKIIKTYNIDVVISVGSPAAAWAAKIKSIPHLAFNDTETAIEQRLLYLPASKKIFTPACLLADYGPKQVRYNGTHDLAYLRPEHFTPDPKIKDELHITENEKYAVLRFVSWEATHDWGKAKTAVNTQYEIAKAISQNMRIFISAEKKLSSELEQFRLPISPGRFHDAIAFADIVVGDGATTATEAAALGVPSLYISTFADSLGYLSFFSRYGLLKAVKTREEGNREIKLLIENPEREKRKIIRDKLLSETIDVALFIADKCEEFSGKNRNAK